MSEVEQLHSRWWRLDPRMSPLSSPGVLTFALLSQDTLPGRCYGIEPFPGEENEYIAYVAYPLDLFEEGSVTNMFTSIVVIDRQKNHGMHFRVLAKALRMSGGDHIHFGTIVGKFEGEREITLGFVDLLCDDFIEKDRSRGIYFTQDWVSLSGVLSVASGGIHIWHMPALTEIFGDDSVLQFVGGTLENSWGNAPGAVANRVALEACVNLALFRI
ncbi:hypothetical protein L1987_79584 [Smallanthus sonchifolius]|uniref:Uncharacterized protein n=1 Tax=Smallanthus sonchifolius TaxID=185202 RepID=A0ACB8YPH4_9ASTR|nr:hypothetical protein L1987_79584 [Smallanthus sonchifolius]